MPDLGDYITRLLCDASKYTQGTSAAVAGNKELSGSCNSIIGQLNRQAKALETAGRTTLDWINADEKASEEVKEHTRNLLAKVDALKKLDAAQKGLPTSSVVGNGLGVPSDKQRDIDARRAAGKSGDAWREEDQAEKDRIEAIRKRNLDIVNARRAEAEAERKAMNDTRALSRQRAQDRRDDANVMRQLDEQGYGKKNRPGHQNEEKRSTRQWAGVEGFRAIEDFAQGSAFGGLRGGLLAASNNISQMGAAYGATGAIAGSAISTVIVLGSQLYETWRKAAYGGNEANAAIKEYDRMVSSVLSHTRELGQLRITSRDMQSGSSFDGAVQNEQRLRDNATRREEDLKAKDEAFKDQMAGMGAQGLTSGDLNSEASRREETVWGLRRNAASEQHANLSDEALTIENRRRVGEQERENIRGHQLLHRERMQIEQAQQLALARGQAEADRNQAVERSRRVGGVGPLTEWQQMEKERGFANDQNAKDKSKFDRGQSWFQNQSEQMLLAGMKTDKERESYAAQKEYEQRLRGSAEAEQRGVISPTERATFDANSKNARDRKMREAKYGDLQADGNSGFGSADVKSSQGFNTLVKAMRYSEQDKTIAELKKNGDITKESSQAIVDVLNIKLSAPVPVVDFN